jgi:hypothetical protein
MLRGTTHWILTASILAVAAPAAADLAIAPSGGQIASLAKSTRFDPRSTFSPRAGVQVTPALPSPGPVANGKVVALLRNQVALRALPPGQYHLCAARIGGTWQTIAESNGRVVAKTKAVAVGGSSNLRSGMCFGWYECHNGQCVCYGIVIRGTPF